MINEKMIPKQAQLVLFFSPDTVYKSMTLAAQISEALIDIFPQEPNIISLPPNVPIEAPRIIFQNGNGSLTIGMARADLFLNCMDSNEWLQTEFLTKCVLLSDLLLSNRIRINRVALVLHAELNISIDDIRSRYIKEAKLNNINELELSWLRTFTADELAFNRWVRFLMNGALGKRLLIDFNTLGETIIDLTRFPVGTIIEKFITQIGDFDNVIDW